jgi:biotin synthase-related radical SAM superfamily protein
LPPKLDAYRRIQLARYLIVNGKANLQEMKFDGTGKIISYGVHQEVIEHIIEGGLALSAHPAAPTATDPTTTKNQADPSTTTQKTK